MFDASYQIRAPATRKPTIVQIGTDC